MTIRRTTAAILIATALGLILTTEVISRTLIRDGFDDLETATAETDLARAQHAIEREVARMESTVVDWAEWDDTYFFVETGDPEYIRLNVDVDTLEGLDLSVFAIIASDGTPMLLRSEDRETGEPLPFPSEMISHLALPQTASGLDTYSASGLLGLSAAPMAFAAHPIRTSVGTGPSSAVLVMGRYLDDTAIERIGETTLLSMAIREGASAHEVAPLSGDVLLARESLTTAGGEKSYSVELQLPRDIADRGAATTSAMLLAVGAAGLGFGIVTFLLLEVLVLRRLRRLGRAMGRLGRQGDLTARLESEGSDEVARLARDINGMLAALEVSEAQFRLVVASVSDGLVLVRDGGIAYANEAARTMFGWSHDDPLDGVDIAGALPEKLREAIASVEGDGRELTPLEVTIQPPGGPARLADVSLGRVETRRGPAVHLLFRDITERSRAEERRLALERKVQEAQRLESIGLLAGGVAHDFNNLLMAIAGNASIARLSIPRESEAEEALVEIENATTRAADLTRQLLAYAGRGRLVVTAFDLSAVAAETARLVKRIGGRDARVSLDLAESLPSVEGDETQVRQVVMNLLTNAIDATAAREAAVTVRTSLVKLAAEDIAALPFDGEGTPGPFVALDVIDDGEGMTAAAMSQIFEPFFSTKGPGRGLGLAAVRGILRAHGGAITVTSAPGKGTHFRVLLPAAAAAEPEPKLPKPAPIEAVGRALAVDDEESVLGVAARMLGRLGYDVVRANDGDEACDQVEGCAFDLVLLDVAMPRMNGVEAFREIRSRCPELPVVLMSGFTFQELPPDVAGDPRLTFIQKPFTFVSLASAISLVARETSRPA